MSCPGSYHNSTQGGSLRALEVGRCHPTPQSVRKLPPGGKVTQARVRNTLMVRQAMPWVDAVNSSPFLYSSPYGPATLVRPFYIN